MSRFGVGRFVLVVGGLMMTPAILMASSLVAPMMRASVELASLVTFAGGAGVPLLSLVLLTRGPLGARGRGGIAAFAVLCFGLALLPGMRGMLEASLIGCALTSIGYAIGDGIGERIEHAGHLLPAVVVAGAADIVSVVDPGGVSHAIASDERYLSLAAVSFPVRGTVAHAPVLGVGDLLFAALLLGAVRRHKLPRLKASLLIAFGIAAAGLVSALSEIPIPAIPVIGLMVVGGIASARVIPRKDKRAAAVFMACAVALALLVVARRLLE